jgi:hypothetical protein
MNEIYMPANERSLLEVADPDSMLSGPMIFGNPPAAELL